MRPLSVVYQSCARPRLAERRGSRGASRSATGRAVPKASFNLA